MGAHPELFVDLQWKDCWKYINNGYIVYFVWKNSEGSGHICTGYPTDDALNPVGAYKLGKIVQAGVETKTKILQMAANVPWPISKLKNVKTYLYLGYLKF